MTCLNMSSLRDTPSSRDSSVGIPSVNRVLRELRRQEHSLYNCVASIVADAAFVAEARFLNHPLRWNLPQTAGQPSKAPDTAHGARCDLRQLWFSPSRV
jgi:hypothetical protein